ncbi:MAG: formylglycine-generating enzyme family protein [Planctomycetota bacterium]
MCRYFLLLVLVSCVAVGLFAQEQPKQPPGPPDTPAKEEPQNSPQPKIHLKDGSILVGKIKLDSIKVTTDFGVLTVPKDYLIGIKVGENDDEVQTDKFTIKGKVEIDLFEVTTKSGALKIPKKDIKFIAFSEKFLSDTFTNSIGIKFVKIEAGEFMMGSPENEKDRQSDETQHKVKITKPFYIQTTEVTQAQWKAVMGNNPSYFQGPARAAAGGDDLPVEKVSWDDAQEFIKKLNSKEGKNVYRLPTEAEWEYACRAGSTTRFCYGDDESKLRDYAWYQDNSDSKTHPVGTKLPNAWGLYDMHGNVLEWCNDSYDAGYYTSSPANDPQGPTSGEGRVLRGGSWNSVVALFFRSASRGGDHRSYRLSKVYGFRLARSSE